MENNLKTITSSFVWEGKALPLVYKDANNFNDLPKELCQQVYGICFYDEKIVLAKNGKNWTFLGGHIEKGEDFETALRREIQEESNMKVIKFLPVGYQQIFGEKGNDLYQLRYVCKVEPYGEFIKDPMGDVTEIKLVEIKDFKKYIDWGEVGDRLLERALELKKSFLEL